MPSTSLSPRQAGIYKLLNLKAGEGRSVGLFGVYSLLMGAAIAVFYTCTTSLFLTSFERRQLPLSFVASGALIYVLGLVVRRMQRALPFARVNALLMLFMLVTVGGMLLLNLVAPSKWIYFVLFMWNRVFIYVNGVVFWATMGRVFNLEQSKRLFSFIGLGDVVASIISYLSVPVLLHFFASDRLLVVAFGFLVLCAAMMKYIRQHYHQELSAAKPSPTASLQSLAPSGKEKLLDHSYYSLLYLLSFLPVFGLIYVEYMFTVLSKDVYPNKQSLASFIGLFFGICSIIELLIKLFAYNKLITTYSIRIGIVLLPLLLLFSYSLAAVYGTANGVTPIFFAFIALSRFFMSAIRRSISDPAFQVLFQPIAASTRTVLQSRIEGGPKALGTLLTGLLLLGLAALGFSSMVELSYIFLAVLAFWAINSFRIQPEYRTMLAEAIGRSAAHIHRPTLAPTPVPTPTPAPALPSSQSLEELAIQVASESAEERCCAATALGQSSRFYAYRYLPALLDDPVPAVREAAIAAAGTLRKPELWPRLLHYLSTPAHAEGARAALLAIGEPVVPALAKEFDKASQSAPAQARLAGFIGQVGGEAAKRFLRANLQHPNQLVRDEAVAGLTQQHYRATVTERPHLLRQLDEQVEQLVWLGATRLDLNDHYPADSVLIQALYQEEERSTAQLFGLLSLIYGNKQFDVIRELITHKNREIQGFLLELLGNILPAEVKDTILPLFAHVPLAEKVRLNAGRYPQQQLAPEERLHDLINRDYTKLKPWVKSLAIYELRQWHKSDPTAILVANAVMPEAVIAETALYVLHELSPVRFAALHTTWQTQAPSLHLALSERIAAGLPTQALLVHQQEATALAPTLAF